MSNNNNNQEDSRITLVTKEGLKKLKEELEYLKDVRRKEVAERIKEAISYGDLSENSEYEEAKNEQGFVEGRIHELEEKIKYAKVIQEKHGKTVQLGTRVKIKNISKKNSEPEEYVIVGSTEADPLSNKISNESPVGSAILDKSKGDIVKVSVPDGAIEYEVLSLE
jgi:transcription elongation factor GreA